ncbi:MAG TPA: hypothetical protein DCQ51_01005 [Planktothrix sp. UBA8407]|jgi:hypothetical protein|nr:hypothetical protein [Planktothrix sp. UBA8407]HBK23512.1 hypothetical protein [Planktothrix sp. UBA10369]
MSVGSGADAHKIEPLLDVFYLRSILIIWVAGSHPSGGAVVASPEGLTTWIFCIVDYNLLDRIPLVYKA